MRKRVFPGWSSMRLIMVVLFRSRLRDDAGPDYAPAAERMVELARAMPGFVSFHHCAADDGERISVIEFESAESMRAWREHPEHREAQRRGRSQWYSWYRNQICEQQRESELGDRPE
jgi:heme-degrading monooxygenase HmoA